MKNRMKSRIKNLAAMSIAATMAMTSMAAPVFADSANPQITASTIDTTKSGSITIFKVKENNGKTIDNKGTQGATSATQTPMKGVEFSAIKVADIETLTTKNGVGVYFDNLDQDFKSLILNSVAKEQLTEAKDADGTLVTNGSAPVVTRPDGSGDTQAYTTETMQKVMDTINAAQGGEKSLNDFVINNRGNNAKTIFTGTTDANGETVLDKLPLGLYLVCETDISGYDPQTGEDKSTASQIANGGTYSDKSGQITVDPHQTATGQDKVVGETTRDEVVANQSSPLLVSVPMTNQTTIGNNAAGTAWQYDVTVYPKNQTINNPKRIIKEDDKDTLIDHGDYEIGETVHQVLLPEAPMLQDGNAYTKFVETDTMDNGLTFDKINGVYIVPRIANPEKMSDYGTLTDSFQLQSGSAVELTKDDYDLAKGEKDSNGNSSFTVTLTEAGLEKLNAITEDSQVMILFDSVLNKDTQHVGDQVEEENQPTLTWNTSDNGGETDTDHSIKGNKVGVYTYKLNVKKNGVKDPTRVSFTFKREGTGAGSNENHVKDSDVQFVKEGDGIYHLYDRTSEKTDDIVTTVHPGSDGKLYIKGLDEEHYIMTETATEGREDESGAKSHELLKSKVTIALTSVPTDDSNSNHGVTGALDADKTTITADGNTAAIAVAKGTASFNVENYESLNLRTGGEGRAMVYGATLLIVVGAGSVLVLATRKKKKTV
ncbi:SpaH/EbpB family LPXTG-anchored major pilin [Bilifractor sp. HCP3S3_D3]|uniref:SpaH/EbpB family LPXTG-anchored major pilin n=1 Tax=Bilifractor sp. HCP3S3_D3 TaxID=3438907 RepID=UPI003F8B2900